MPRRSAPTYRKSAARDELRDRLKAALARRLHPRGPWAIKQLAGAIGASPDTVERVFNGQQEALALLLYELARAFRSAGDIGFLREVYGEVVEPAPTPAALLREALRQIETKF